ncbi:YheU family protein [Teredinibacter sp. KSP-S5-2]|uniref:YheU family protein n=1 Tax=Teredinibacter sp. KSP-S5-2 TaxID=3034506 RepID=UPI002934457C|nr:YheU family protein [Teredinibacter sp. KSP-S5-2]WNO09917.1 YheU family protein [Teredinibacter sp. KSP-S5-2]
MIIPAERLTEEVIRGIVESYITREGTDYGATELSMEEKVAELLPLVLSGEVLISYDENGQSLTLLTKAQFHKAAG